MPRDTKKAVFRDVIEVDGQKYIVEAAGQSNVRGCGFGWHIIARRLKKDGTYNPSGKKIDFIQNGVLKVVGKATIRFT